MADYCPGRLRSNQQNGQCTLRCSSRSVKSSSLLIQTYLPLIWTTSSHCNSLQFQTNMHGIDALHINLLGLIAYACPPMVLLHRVIWKIYQCSCLIILIAPDWQGIPWFWDEWGSQQKSHSSYQCQWHLSSSLTTKPSCLAYGSEQLQELSMNGLQTMCPI